jgi:hypothetical protein
MDYKAISNGLKDYNEVQVKVYINYLQEVEKDKNKDGTKKNKWFHYFTPEQAIDLYKKVAIDNLFIDGDTITLQFKGKVMVSYNYQAYKNRVLNIYPETKFDVQNVYQGDDFHFEKNSGTVKYKHVLSDPFSEQKTIMGCYCIIKNNRGEFIETLNMAEVTKMRNVAKTQNVWNTWFSEMVLKSVVKRACKRHFKDLVVNIELIDNDNYDLEAVNINHTIKDEIEKCQTNEELEVVYKTHKPLIEDEVAFIKLLSERKKEINENVD